MDAQLPCSQCGKVLVAVQHGTIMALDQHGHRLVECVWLVSNSYLAHEDKGYSSWGQHEHLARKISGLEDSMLQ